MSWPEAIGDSDPVRGIPEEFGAVERVFDGIESQALRAVAQFESIANRGPGFRGEAADALSEHAGDVLDRLRVVPKVAGSVESVIRAHRTTLVELRAEAASALVRAQSNWSELHTAESDRSDALQRLSVVETQLDYLDRSGAGEDPERPYWEGQLTAAIGWERSSSSRLDGARDAVEHSRADWKSLREREDELNQRTSANLVAADLGEMGDPSAADQVRAAVDDFVNALAEFGEYFFSMDFVEDLYNALEVFALVCSVLSLVATALAFVLAPTGVGAAFFGAVAGGLKVAALVAGAVRVRLGLYLVMDGRLEPGDWAKETALFLVSAGVSGVVKSGTSIVGKYGVRYADMAYRAAEGAEAIDDVKTVNDAFSYTSDGYKVDDVARRSFEHLRSAPSRFDFDRPRLTFDFQIPSIRYTRDTCLAGRTVPLRWSD